MPFSEIDILPDPPQRDGDPDTFADLADIFVVAMQTMTEQLNVFKAELETAAALINAAPAYADPGLVALAGLTPAANKLAYFTGASTSALTDLTSVARTLIAQSSQANMRTTGLGMSANGSSLVSAADYAAMKALLDLEIGTDVQAYDADLAAIAGLTSAADKAPYFTGAGAASLMTVTSFIRTLLDDADGPTALTTLGGLGITASSLGSTGYIKFSNGFMIQWGSTTVAANGSTTATYGQTYTTWSKAFPTGVGEFNTGQAPTQAEGHTFTTTGFDIFTGSENIFTAHWVAIGV